MLSELIRIVLEIKTSILFNLVFASGTILSCFFFFFSIIALRFLTTAVIAQIETLKNLIVHIL